MKDNLPEGKRLLLNLWPGKKWFSLIDLALSKGEVMM